MSEEVRVEWRGVPEMKNGIRQYGAKAKYAVKQVALYWAPVLETYAKQNAAWTDRTANARQSLHAWVEDLSETMVALYLSHGVHYGIFLEVGFSGKYAIIWPTIERHIDPIAKMLQGIFGR